MKRKTWGDEENVGGEGGRNEEGEEKRKLFKSKSERSFVKKWEGKGRICQEELLKRNWLLVLTKKKLFFI